MDKSYVYLLECVSNWETTYKIGFTKNKNISKRIKGLQTGNKDVIKCIDIFETHHGRKVETALHNFYAGQRLGGEWFDLELKDVIRFQDLCGNIEKNLDKVKIYSHNQDYQL